MNHAPRIFLSYRSGDDAYAAALLDERLSRAFGSDAIFRASRSIPAGESYTVAIRTALNTCSTVLALIGPNWLERLQTHEPAKDDWVRIEIATALNNGSRVIPLLLSRASRLATVDLPQDVAALAERQYLTFEHRNIERDLALLVEALQHGDRVTAPEGRLPISQVTGIVHHAHPQVVSI